MSLDFESPWPLLRPLEGRGSKRVRRFRLTVLARFTATALALLWCLQPLLLVAHASAHAHRFCAEHGAFEEGAPSLSEAPGSSRPQWRGAEEALPAEGAQEAGHQECPTAVASGPEVPWPSAGTALLLTAAPLPLRLSAEAPRFAPVALLHLAPKASPPAHRA
jgi:hypothetical protein